MGEWIDAKTKLVGLFSDPCNHSNSPKMHNKSFSKLGINMVYLSFQINESNLKDAIDALRIFKMVGANLSMPNKFAVIPYLDQLSPAAKLIGAVNTIVNKAGILIGHNTDGIGYVKSLEQEGINIKDKKMIIMGAGGAATAIAIQSALQGAGEIALFNRSEKNGEAIIKRINENTDCKARYYNLNDKERLKREMDISDILTNTTNIGMGDLQDQSVIKDACFFRKGLVVVDIIYNPEKTIMLKMAEEKGCKTINGLGMLLYQGAEAFKLWTGEDMPIITSRYGDNRV